MGRNVFALQSTAKGMIRTRGQRHADLIHGCPGIISHVGFGKKPDIQIFKPPPCGLSPFPDTRVGIVHYLRGQPAPHDHAISQLTSQA
jgi:hypothetical protein